MHVSDEFVKRVMMKCVYKGDIKFKSYEILRKSKDL